MLGYDASDECMGGPAVSTCVGVEISRAHAAM